MSYPLHLRAIPSRVASNRGGKPGERLAGTGRGLTGAGGSFEKTGKPLAGTGEGSTAEGESTENIGELL